MAYHSLASCLFHCVFSTKNRLPLIPQQSQSRLWAYMGGIARTNDFTALAVGGISGPRPSPFVASANPSRGQSNSAGQSRVLDMAARAERYQIRMAGRLRRFQHWSVSGGRHHPLYSEPGKTSCTTDIRSGMEDLSAAPWVRGVQPSLTGLFHDPGLPGSSCRAIFIRACRRLVCRKGRSESWPQLDRSDGWWNGPRASRSDVIQAAASAWLRSSAFS
jgi:hypothetical protein